MRPVSKKEELRQQAKEILSAKKRKELLGLSKKIIKNLISLNGFFDKNSYFIYVSDEKEVFTHELVVFLLKKKKTVLVPKTRGKEMSPVQIKSF